MPYIRDPLAAYSLRATPQTMQADARQVPNSAGGYAYTVDSLTRLRRFLILGTSGGTYYTSGTELTRDGAQFILDFMAHGRGQAVVDEVVAVSTTGRAPKPEPALFVLALAASAGDEATRKAALAALPSVARTGSHLFTFVTYAQNMRGWGRGLRQAVGRWYSSKDADSLAYQVAKYRQREGWTHRDLLRKTHPAAPTPGHRATYEWLCGRDGSRQDLPLILRAHELLLRTSTTAPEAAAVIREHGGAVSWEMLRPDLLNEPEVWRALLEQGLPQTALMRQLPRLTRLGVLTGSTLTAVTAQLAGGMARGRVHPVNVLVAQRTYAQGHGDRGRSTWEPLHRVTDALDAGFYQAFGGVEPAGKRTLVALDVSGSMGWSVVAGMPLTAREASAAMAMVTVATEPEVTTMAFGTSFHPLDLSARRRLDDAVAAVSNLPFGGTDCAVPMLYALDRSLQVDTFVVYTDNETWAGAVHPHQALERYRQASGIPARLVVVGLTSTDFTIADPTDAGMLDVVGMDTAAPSLIAAFSRGDF